MNAAAGGPETVICRYVVRSGREAEFEALLARHWPTLHRVGLVTDDPPQVYRGRPSSKPGGAHGSSGTYVEVFTWRDGAAPGRAHESPDVMAVWGPMGECCSEMDFPHFDRIDPLTER
ncbi:MAG: hypothetical protein R3F34_04350 [Planctomycetota bacterium]